MDQPDSRLESEIRRANPASAEEPQPAAPSEPAHLSQQELREFLKSEQGYLSDNIRNADVKAAALYTMSLGGLGYLFNDKRYADLFSVGVDWFRSRPLCGLSASLLVLSIALSLLCILPRLWTSGGESLIFWEKIASQSRADRYFNLVCAQTTESLNKDLAEHCFTLACICARKYKYLSCCLWTAPFGLILGLLSLAW